MDGEREGEISFPRLFLLLLLLETSRRVDVRSRGGRVRERNKTSEENARSKRREEKEEEKKKKIEEEDEETDDYGV